jgi:hypothetical protein
MYSLLTQYICSLIPIHRTLVNKLFEDNFKYKPDHATRAGKDVGFLHPDEIMPANGSPEGLKLVKKINRYLQVFKNAVDKVTSGADADRGEPISLDSIAAGHWSDNAEITKRILISLWPGFVKIPFLVWMSSPPLTKFIRGKEVNYRKPGTAAQAKSANYTPEEKAR